MNSEMTNGIGKRTTNIGGGGGEIGGGGVGEGGGGRRGMVGRGGGGEAKLKGAVCRVLIALSIKSVKPKNGGGGNKNSSTQRSALDSPAAAVVGASAESRISAAGEKPEMAAFGSEVKSSEVSDVWTRIGQSRLLAMTHKELGITLSISRNRVRRIVEVFLRTGC